MCFTTHPAVVGLRCIAHGKTSTCMHDGDGQKSSFCFEKRTGLQKTTNHTKYLGTAADLWWCSRQSWLCDAGEKVAMFVVLYGMLTSSHSSLTGRLDVFRVAATCAHVQVNPRLFIAPLSLQDLSCRSKDASSSLLSVILLPSLFDAQRPAYRHHHTPWRAAHMMRENTLPRNESIYALIPKPSAAEQKLPLYHSKVRHGTAAHAFCTA
jgi:hypothetical protein